MPAINADQGIGKRLRKVSGQPEDGVEVLAEQDTAAVRPALVSEIVERDTKLRVVVTRCLHLGDGAFELCKRLAANIGNTFPGEGLVLLADERCFLTVAQLARGEKPGAQRASDAPE